MIKLTGKLGNGLSTIIDDEFEYLSKYKWHFCGGYASRLVHIRMENGKPIHKREWLHRIINNTPSSMDTDHINRNRLDNRKSNLRSVTRSVNMHNKGKVNNNSKSNLQGAFLRADRNKWRSYINIGGKPTYLGSFNTELEAHKAYMKVKRGLV